MDAFLFTLALFAYFFLIGFALVSVAGARLRVVEGILVSPIIGVSVIVLLVFFINRAGVPVKEFGRILSISLLLLSLIVIAIGRPVFPTRKILPFLVVVLIGLLLAARPMFNFGFDWISFANEDMANYSLGAQRFYENGFFAPPDLKAFFEGRDYSQAFWYMHVLSRTRSGSELLLAEVWAATTINPHRSFMPVMFALHASLLAAAGSLLCKRSLPKAAPIVVTVLLALSPMTTLGAVYQLIAQVGGLSLLCVASLLLFRPLPKQNWIARLRFATLPTLVICTLFVYYPEVIPFLGLGWVFFIGLTHFRNYPGRGRGILALAAMTGLLTLIALNSYVYEGITFLLNQTSAGVNATGSVDILFPYFLIPTGLPVLWGLTPIARDMGLPITSVAILAGFFCSVIFLYLLKQQLQRNPTEVSCISLVMLIAGMVLFYRDNGFGSFKLVMFAQPFILGVVAIYVSGSYWARNSLSRRCIGVGALAACAASQAAYVEKSTGQIVGSFAELPFASKNALVSEFRTKFTSIGSKAGVLDTNHVVLAKFQALYTRGTPVLFPSSLFYDNIMEDRKTNLSNRPDMAMELARYDAAKAKAISEYTFNTSEGVNTIYKMPNKFGKAPLLELVPGRFDILNGFSSVTRTNDFFHEKVPNLPSLQFIRSSLGQHYYRGEAGYIALYPMELDPMFPGQKFAGLGRHFVFALSESVEAPMAVIELTSTLSKQFESTLPDASVQGKKVGFVGRGSGRIISPQLEPTSVEGAEYIAVDMGRIPKLMLQEKNGLMLAYGKNIRLDSRLMTTFGRDISIISSANYNSMTLPDTISKFPADLVNKSLEYSGMYEDGWISEKAFFILQPKSSQTILSIAGSIPLVSNTNFKSTISVRLNGVETAQRQVGLGDFEFKLPIAFTPGRQRIDITFSNYQKLPGEDGRIIGAKIAVIGFSK